MACQASGSNVRIIHRRVALYRTVRALVLTSDDRQIISASNDFTVIVWDLQSGQALRTFYGHADIVTALAITSDDRWVISVSRDGVLIVWNLQSGQIAALASLEAGSRCRPLTLDNISMLVGDEIGNIYCLRYTDPNAQ